MGVNDAGELSAPHRATQDLNAAADIAVGGTVKATSIAATGHVGQPVYARASLPAC